MGWTTIDPARVAAGKPGATDFGTDVINDLEDLNTRVDQAFASSVSGLSDDFFLEAGAAVDRTPPGLWIADTTGGGANPTILSPHRVRLQHASSATDRSAFYAGAHILHADLNLYDFTVVHEFRVKTPADINPAGIAAVFLGLQDASITGNALATDVSDCIGLTLGTTTGMWNSRVALGGSGATTTQDVATQTAWTVFRFTITQDSVVAGNRKVIIDVDGSPIADSPVTTNLPLIGLRPTFAMVGSGVASGDETIYIDYVTWQPTSRPREI